MITKCSNNPKFSNIELWSCFILKWSPALPPLQTTTTTTIFTQWKLFKTRMPVVCFVLYLPWLLILLLVEYWDVKFCSNLDVLYLTDHENACSYCVLNLWIGFFWIRCTKVVEHHYTRKTILAICWLHFTIQVQAHANPFSIPDPKSHKEYEEPLFKSIVHKVILLTLM